MKITYFLPEDGSANFVLRRPYKETDDILYFGLLDSNPSDSTGNSIREISENFVSAAKIPDDHPLIVDKFANRGETLITVQMPSNIGLYWQPAVLYIYGCEIGQSQPKIVSSIAQPVSSGLLSRIIAVVIVLVVYFSAVAASYHSKGSLNWKRYLDPVVMTAGGDGKASLAKMQILFFSLIVFGLLGYIVARNGIVSDLSSTVLTLLGIAALGSTLGKIADTQNNRIDTENWLWFAGKGWLKPRTEQPPNSATWRQLVTTDGEFDVYRYQSCIFSLVVGGALLVVGANELASFSVPGNILNILLLSQGVYVFGKLVTTTPIADLNRSASVVRGLEKAFRSAVESKYPPSVAPVANQAPPRPADLAEAIQRAKPEYEKYKEAVVPLALFFQETTGQRVDDSKLEPSYST